MGKYGANAHVIDFSASQNPFLRDFVWLCSALGYGLGLWPGLENEKFKSALVFSTFFHLLEGKFVYMLTKTEML